MDKTILDKKLNGRDVVNAILGDRLTMLTSIASNVKNMFEFVDNNSDEEAETEEEFEEEITESTTESIAESVKVKRNSRVVIPVRNGNATVVVPTDKEEKHNLINKINALLPRTANRMTTEKLSSHSIEELEVFYEQLQGKADALSEEGEFDLD